MIYLDGELMKLSFEFEVLLLGKDEFLFVEIGFIFKAEIHSGEFLLPVLKRGASVKGDFF